MGPPLVFARNRKLTLPARGCAPTAGTDARPTLLFVAALAFAALGCRQKMDRQPRYDPLEGSDFFANGMASRPLVEGTIARGHLRLDEAYETGMVDGEPVDAFPPRVFEERTQREVLRRGRERFDIFCSPCHDRLGNGQGMVVRRGFPSPPSYHIERLRKVPVGHFFEVGTNGFGRMPSYADQVPTQDRWAIAAYIRALQLSRNAQVSRLPEADREQLSETESETGE